MKKTGFSSESGKSVIEILIVVVIAGILMTIAVTRIGSAHDNLERQNLAREMKVNLERARFDAIKRRASTFDQMARVTILSATSFSVTTDMNQNGSIDSSDTRVVNFSGRTNVRIVGDSGLTFPVTIRFDRRGYAFATNSSGTGVAPVFTFCEGECTASTANSANANIIAVSPTGTVAMLWGGESLPAFTSPNVSTVNTGSGINPLLRVSVTNSNTSSGTSGSNSGSGSGTQTY